MVSEAICRSIVIPKKLWEVAPSYCWQYHIMRRFEELVGWEKSWDCQQIHQSNWLQQSKPDPQPCYRTSLTSQTAKSTSSSYIVDNIVLWVGLRNRCAWISHYTASIFTNRTGCRMQNQIHQHATSLTSRTAKSTSSQFIVDNIILWDGLRNCCAWNSHATASIFDNSTIFEPAIQNSKPAAKTCFFDDIPNS